MITVRKSCKLHRPTAILAALIIAFSQLLEIFAVISSPVYSRYWLTNGFDILISVLLVVVLFRSRKDVFAGIVFLLSAMVSLLSVLYDLFSICFTVGMQGYLLMRTLVHFLVAIFHTLAALECLDASRISAGAGRIFLWLLPLLSFDCALAEQMILSINSGMLINEAVFGSMVYTVPQWLGPILMGVALAIRTHKQAEYTEKGAV